MKVFEAYPDMYRYKLLPQFAQHLLDHHLDALNQEQYRLSQEIDLPLLQHLKHIPEEQLLAFSRASLEEYLQYLAGNKAKELIELSLQRWLSDQLQIIKKFEVVAEDITLINHIRFRAFRKFIPRFTTHLPTALSLIDELDNMLTGSNTSSVDTYIDLLKDRISRKEAQLLDAQSIARVGSFEWDLITDVSENTPEMYHILETDSEHYESFLNHVHEDDRLRVATAMNQAMITGHYDCEFRYKTKSGQKVLWVRGLVSFREGKPVLMQGTVQDITERKRMEETLLQKTIELQRSNEELQHFASVASHDLKEPLRKITLYTDLVLRQEGSKLSETSLNNMNRVIEASRRMQNLMEDLLAYSSLAQPQQVQKANLQKLFEETLETLDQTIQEKKAQITTDGLPDAVVIPFQFRQLLQNLLSNSLKFVAKGQQPVIGVTHRFLPQNEVPEGVRRGARYLELLFTDNGIGFDPSSAEKLFGLFSRLHSRAEYEGTGLGLSICRKVAENHGGIVRATAEPGKGAQFLVIIPQD